MNADIAVIALPEGFEGYIQGGSYRVSKVFVENGGESEVTLHISVPDELSEGNYTVMVRANAGLASDELSIIMDAKECSGFWSFIHGIYAQGGKEQIKKS